MKNQKIILWKMNMCKENAYKDQYGVPHRAIVVEEEILATIVEYKTLTIEDSKHFRPFAIKATSEDGRFFLLARDWTSYWYETDSKFKKLKADFKNAVTEFNTMEYQKNKLPQDTYYMIPVIRENGDLAIPQDVGKCTCPHYFSNGYMKFHWYYKPNGHCECLSKKI